MKEKIKYYSAKLKRQGMVMIIDSRGGKNESFGHPGVLGNKHFFCWDWGFEERQQRAAPNEI